MQKAPAGMLDVEVEVTALAPLQTQLQLAALTVAVDPVRPTALDTVEDPDQPLPHTVPLGHQSSTLLLVDVDAAQVLEGPAAGPGECFSLLTDRRRRPQHESLKILEEHLRLVQVLLKNRRLIQAPQGPLQPDPVEAMQNSQQVVRMMRDERVGGAFGGR